LKTGAFTGDFSDTPEAYRPLADVRTILTGVSSRISMMSLLPEEAAACASAVRERDDDFRSRSPPKRDWANIRRSDRLAGAFSRRIVFAFAASTEETLLFVTIVLEENSPLGGRFASFTKIAFAIVVSFWDAVLFTPCHRGRMPTEASSPIGISGAKADLSSRPVEATGLEGEIATFPHVVT
jgi:hypothetical protein